MSSPAAPEQARPSRTSVDLAVLGVGVVGLALVLVGGVLVPLGIGLGVLLYAMFAPAIWSERAPWRLGLWALTGLLGLLPYVWIVLAVLITGGN